MALTGVEELGFERAGLCPVGRGRRVGVVVLSVSLALAVCAFIGLAFVQSSWWYAYGTDQALDDESRARVEAIRNEVDAGGAAPKAVVWLDAALEPGVHPSDVRAYLLAAQGALGATGDPELAGAAGELRAIVEVIRPTVKQLSGIETTSTPYSAPVVEWP